MKETNNKELKEYSLKDIKSKYILKQIFANLTEKKILEIIKYNKNFQEKLKIDKNDYVEYKKIIIEVIPINISYKNTFINFNRDEKYYHIYFNDENEEKKINYFTKDENVSKIKIIIDPQILYFEKLFNECKCIEKINFIKFKRKDINNMSWMFKGCSSLKELNINNFYTKNVINMNSMFDGCSALKELNLDNFNTNNVTNMSGMFYNCSSLIELNLNNFDTNKVIYMSYMFYKCSSLNELNITDFNTNNVIDMSHMFEGCSSLKELNLHNFNTNNVTDMSYMLYGCSSLKQLNINVNYETNISYMLEGCSSLKELNLKRKWKNPEKEEENKILEEEKEKINKRNEEYQKEVENAKKILSKEPDENDSNSCLIILKYPDGVKTIERRFNKNDKIENLYLFVKSQGREIFFEEESSNFDLMYGFPPKSLDNSKKNTLDEEGLFPNAYIQIKEK